jgi:hypothetical protein
MRYLHVGLSPRRVETDKDFNFFFLNNHQELYQRGIATI